MSIHLPKFKQSGLPQQINPGNLVIIFSNSLLTEFSNEENKLALSWWNTRTSVALVIAASIDLNHSKYAQCVLKINDLAALVTTSIENIKLIS